ncbi:MAG: coagulation factor 5/8 type protein, partial [Acidobacteria bacterium]|nr:coagulation factor 5/8 type protein [Acidobacteriota bacterium]
MRGGAARAVLSLLLALPALAANWTPHPSDGVTMRLTREGDSNRLDFDFHGHAGYAIARRKIDLDLPPNYQFVQRIRGEAPSENLELKLVDATGDNVWWSNRHNFVFPRTWTPLKTKKRQISFAWGPLGGGDPTRADSMELVVTAGSGGKGTVWFTDPIVEPLPPTPTEPVRFESGTIDLGAKRELGGLELEWPSKPPAQVTVTLDGVPHRQPGGRFVWLPDAEARRIQVSGNPKAVIVEPPSWAPAENDFVAIVARATKRGEYPRYFLGEQSYWTVVGADGAEEEALVGEDGNVEPFKGGFSLEPFLHVNRKRLTWADVEISHALAEGDLPIPSVTWKAPGVTMTMTAAVSTSSMLQLRYRVEGDARLELAVRPYQVNPSTQFLN